MLEWLGTRDRDTTLIDAAVLLEDAVRDAFGEGVVSPVELGGNDGTRSITAAVLHRIAMPVKRLS